MTDPLRRYAGSAEIYFGQTLLAEVASCDLMQKSNKKKVETMHKGLAGFAPGTQECEMTLENAVPRAGTEFDFEAAMEAGTVLTVRHVSAGTQRTCSMVIDEVSEKSDTGNAPKLTAKLMGKVTSRRRA
jgi:hypothetical protein